MVLDSRSTGGIYTKKEVRRLLFWWEQRESNPRPSACKADALNQLSYAPLAVRTGLEPATPGVTGRYSNQLNYRTIFVQNYAFFSNADAKVSKKI